MNIVTYKTIEYSKVLFSELNRDMRVDAEYFDPLHIRAEALEKKRPRAKIKSFAVVTDGIHESIAFDDNSPINLISAKAPKENTFDLGGTGYISEKQHEKNPRTALRLNDVVISTVGTIGNCAVVESDILPANSDRHVGIIRIGDANVLPHYVSTYFVTKYGRSATKRETAGNVQPNLYIRNIADLAIPLPSPAFQKRIDALVVEAYRQKQLADKLYADAENLLLKELGLLDWRPDTVRFTLGGREFEVEDSISKISCSAMIAALRMDAEFFSPYSTHILSRIREYGSIELRSNADVTAGYAWKSSYFLESHDEGEPFVRIRDCKPGVIKGEQLDKLDTAYATKQKQPIAEKGDLLVGMDGLKWFYAGLVESPCYVNQRVAWVKPRSSSPFSSEYLLLVINSIVGQTQLLRDMTIADTVGHITNQNVRNLLIPHISSQLHKKITEHIVNSHAARKKSRQLLEQAKRAVELFIEEGELAAMQAIARGEAEG